MSEKKLSDELSDEELAKVAGGEGPDIQTTCGGCALISKNCQECQRVGRDTYLSSMKRAAGAVDSNSDNSVKSAPDVHFIRML